MNECWLLKFIARKLKLAGEEERWKTLNDIHTFMYIPTEDGNTLRLYRKIREFVFQLIKPVDSLFAKCTGRNTLRTPTQLNSAQLYPH